ncbi:hypothetical protein [Amycolatopsis cihanbeyliensis]|uniref:Uncharacterized protein n=1 Tax=Amycolatopsis cihanbeyliensis TaxID=1128664 RepID=A0A542DQV8_AMYCI|nr:hypothetical protein [Amycolatopsis cihanbeyliensis]TQJ05447.1 hypothetical protein FB471_5278 [Amycolatopsis cihanbeyliensis]
MWHIGFLAWRAWVWARVLVPAGLLLWLVYHVHGNSPAFWITTLFVVGVLCGAWFVLRDLARHERDTPARGGRW